MKRVLVVDDNAMVRRVLKEFLSKKGFEVGEASGGAEAVALFDEFQPDLMLLDIKMPGMDGLEVLQKIGAKSSHVRIIMLTAVNDDKTGQEALALGAADFLIKPINLEQVQTHLDVHGILQSE